MYRYKREELERLEKSKLIDIILEQERRLTFSAKGQPKRNNLVGKSFHALTVIADAGNEKGHSTWLCRCSGDIRNAKAAGVCDRTITVWGSNLKGDRQQYCGNESCPAAKQMLGKRRRKERGLRDDESEFLAFLKNELEKKYYLMGNRAEQLIKAEQLKLSSVFKLYYGLTDSGKAYKVKEIAAIINSETVPSIRKTVEQYLDEYKKLTQ